MRRSLALGGFSGTGKSTIGRALAARVALPLRDLDGMLTARWGPIAAQFARDGEAVFRARESDVLREAALGAPAVIATGAGAWIAAENRAVLASCWRVVLSAPLAELVRRIGPTDPARPLWDDDLAARYAARAEAYAVADLQVDTFGRDPGMIADAIARWWAEADSGCAGGYQSASEDG